MIGVAPADIPIVKYVDVIPDDEAKRRLYAVTEAGLDEWVTEWNYDGRDYFSWKDHWQYVPVESLAKAFTHDELICIWHDSNWSSKLGKHIEEHEELIWKVQHSIYRYGGFSRQYEQFIADLAGLRRLDAGLPGFDVRITHTHSINTASYSVHERSRTPGTSLYLDASFAILLYYKSKHVMTIGFAFSDRGISIAQVQLREKHGNRFLYKLPMPYLDFAIDLLQRAYPDDDLWLVTGASTVEAIRRAYGKEASKFAQATADRIQRFYDQTLRGYERTRAEMWGPDDRRVFRRLARSGASRSEEVAA